MPSMHLKIPFYASFPSPGHPEGIHCQETSLKMILGYFLPERNFNIEDIEKITAKQPGKAAWEMPFSLWLASNGFDLKHYSMFDYGAFEARGIEYIRDAFGNEVADWQLAGKRSL